VPRTDLLLADPRLADAERRLGRALVKAAVGRAQQRARDGRIAPEEVADAAVAELPARAAALTPVINATGVLVHTNLGRAPLSAAAADAIVAAAGHCDVEFDLASGTRARRGAGALDALARAVPAAEAVAVVNNNAAALVLAATALTSPETDEIVISRGELIEIGDRFRLPDLLVSTGATLREVGTTNRTTLEDYAVAVGPRTAFVLKVHPSNFRVEGFTAAVAVGDLAGLGPPVVFDIGSGLLAPHPLLPGEPGCLRASPNRVDALAKNCARQQNAASEKRQDSHPTAEGETDEPAEPERIVVHFRYMHRAVVRPDIADTEERGRGCECRDKRIDLQPGDNQCVDYTCRCSDQYRGQHGYELRGMRRYHREGYCP